MLARKATGYGMRVALISCLCNLVENKASDDFSFTVAAIAQKILKSNEEIK